MNLFPVFLLLLHLVLPACASKTRRAIVAVHNDVNDVFFFKEGVTVTTRTDIDIDSFKKLIGNLDGDLSEAASKLQPGDRFHLWEGATTDDFEVEYRSENNEGRKESTRTASIGLGEPSSNALDVFVCSGKVASIYSTTTEMFLKSIEDAFGKGGGPAGKLHKWLSDATLP
eukprot:GHVS01002832.1.p1 GENE.GHVS01002832.1~~GHVS01002832.1.p1  ORF type:complete len:171 (-),score=19.98 GHVS01002832.1:363-875(-)